MKKKSVSEIAQKVRVRFPPSPTGFLHIGSLRTALYNYLFARKHGGEFILRIEDTDRARAVEGGVENIIRTLEWAGLEYDEGPVFHNPPQPSLTLREGDRSVPPLRVRGGEPPPQRGEEGLRIVEQGDYGPYVQSARLDLYKKYADELLEKGSAYVCTCSSERLEELRKEQMAKKLPPKYDGQCRGLGIRGQGLGTSFVVRLKVPETGITTYDDIVHGKMEFSNALIDDQVLMKSDGYPTYHLANVVDDHLMKITHVIRGEEWLSSTPKHVLLYQAFGWEPPIFAHLPLLLNADHSKLSKRQGDVAVEDYIKKGYLPEALLNFVALLGFNPRADKELYTIEELIDEFDLTKVNKSGGVVNFEKLDWMNGNYIRKKTVSDLTELCIPYLLGAGLIKNAEEISSAWLQKIVWLLQDRLKKLEDIAAEAELFLVEQPNYEPALLIGKKMTKESVLPSLRGLYSFLTSWPGWEQEKRPLTAIELSQIKVLIDRFENEVKKWIQDRGVWVGEVLWPMRVALSGKQESPPPFNIALILGKEKTLKRIEYAIKLAEKL